MLFLLEEAEATVMPRRAECAGCEELECRTNCPCRNCIGYGAYYCPLPNCVLLDDGEPRDENGWTATLDFVEESWGEVLRELARR